MYIYIYSVYILIIVRVYMAICQNMHKSINCASKAHNGARRGHGVQLLGLLTQLVMGSLVVDEVNRLSQGIT